MSKKYIATLSGPCCVLLCSSMLWLGQACFALGDQPTKEQDRAL